MDKIRQRVIEIRLEPNEEKIDKFLSDLEQMKPAKIDWLGLEEMIQIILTSPLINDSTKLKLVKDAMTAFTGR